jgi:transposase
VLRDLRRAVPGADAAARRHRRHGQPGLPQDKTAEVERLVRAAGAEVRHLPAYSPDLNPIERLFSKLEEALRSAAARTVDALIEAMGDALRAIRPGDILGGFGHSGYRTDESTATVKRKPL